MFAERRDRAERFASSARLYFLSLADHGRVESVNPDGTDLEILSSGKADGPDGIVVDPQSKKVYWTNMGKVSLDDGSVQRIDLDGSNLTTVVPKGGAFTPKQLKLDAKHGKLYGRIVKACTSCVLIWMALTSTHW